MSSQLLVFNGINVDSGEYLRPPMQPSELARLVEDIPRDDEARARVNQYKAWLDSKGQPHLGVVAGVDPQDLAQTGWGVIFPLGASPAIMEALSPLLEHRRKQATRNGDYYREYFNEKAFRPEDTTARWLARQGASATDPANPTRVPYYLLIVGDPQSIPFRFQYELDVQYAVGRIYFDTLAEYDQYARSVVAAETAGATAAGGSPKAVFFGVQNQDDPATTLSATELVKPLAEVLDKDQANWKERPRWAVETVLANDATKARLGHLLGGDETPRFLFTASHGLGGFEPGDARQVPQQGALVCQDWPGPQEGRGRPVSPDWFFAADDLGDNARVGGLMVFHFACYGAGTPQIDAFSPQAKSLRSEVAPRAFVAALPRRLLGHRRGGALAVVGSIGRAWSHRFLDQGGGGSVRQLDTYQSTLTQLMQGYPVGLAMEYFNERFAALSVELSGVLEDISYGKQVEDRVIASMWTANHDARNLVVLGDPAVRIKLAGKSSAEQPAAHEPVTITPSAFPMTPVSGETQETTRPGAGQAATAGTPANPTPALSQSDTLRALDYMIRDFVTLPQGMSQEEMHDRLLEARAEMGIVVDRQGMPIGLAGLGGQTPLLAVAPGAPLEAVLTRFAESPLGLEGPVQREIDKIAGEMFSKAMEALQTRLRDSPGVAVTDGQRVIGVLPLSVLHDRVGWGIWESRVRRHLAALVSQEQETAYSYDAGTLFGDPTTPPVKITCSVCGATNELNSYIEGRTMCVNPHPNRHLLQVKWS